MSDFKPCLASLTNLMDHVIARHLGRQDRLLTDKIMRAIVRELDMSDPIRFTTDETNCLHDAICLPTGRWS